MIAPEVKSAFYAFKAADDAWSAELRRLFGKRSGDARYDHLGKGEPGSQLRTLHDEFERTRDAWWAMSPNAK